MRKLKKLLVAILAIIGFISLQICLYSDQFFIACLAVFLWSYGCGYLYSNIE